MKRKIITPAPQRRRITPQPNGSNGHLNGNGHLQDTAPKAPPQVVGYNQVTLPAHLRNAEAIAPNYDYKAEWLHATRQGPKVLGYPDKYRVWHPNIVFEMRLCGAADRRIAIALDVSEETINRWKLETGIPEIHEAYTRGGELADARVAKSMYHRAVGYSHPEEKIFYDKDIGTVIRVETVKHYAPDATAGQFWLTNRQKQHWRNRITNEVVDQDGNTLVPPQLVVMPVSPKNEGNENGNLRPPPASQPK